MSKPRYKWWGYIKNVIRAYPGLKREFADLHDPKVTANVSGMPGGGGASDPTMQVAIRELPGTKQREYEAVRAALEATRRQKTAKEALAIIDMVFWKNSHTLSGAAYRVGVSYETAKIYQRDFILRVAAAYGLLDEPQKINHKSQKDVVK
mgnify:CR=1 FL=1